MDESDTSNGLKGFEVYPFLSALAERGTSAAEIQRKLVERGISPDEAARLTERAIAFEKKRDTTARANSILSTGTRLEELAQRLIREGCNPEIVAVVVKEAARDLQENKGDERRFLRYLGGFCIVVGFALACGNMSGLSRPSPTLVPSPWDSGP